MSCAMLTDRLPRGAPQRGADDSIHGLEDNGLGGQVREGNGLRGMRERVQSIAGTMKHTCSANGGTSLEITLPPANESLAKAASQIFGEAETL